MLTKFQAARIDNGWVFTETGKESDGSTYKRTRHCKDETALQAEIEKALEAAQKRLDE